MDQHSLGLVRVTFAKHGVAAVAPSPAPSKRTVV